MCPLIVLQLPRCAPAGPLVAPPLSNSAAWLNMAPPGLKTEPWVRSQHKPVTNHVCKMWSVLVQVAQHLGPGKRVFSKSDCVAWRRSCRSLRVLRTQTNISSSWSWLWSRIYIYIHTYISYKHVDGSPRTQGVFVGIVWTLLPLRQTQSMRHTVTVQRS